VGTVIERKELSDAIWHNQLIILKSPCEEEKSAFSMNKLMAEALLELRPMQRTMQIGKCFGNLVVHLGEKPLIKDIDVMFNPDYKIDVINVLTTTYKKTPFTIIWSGDIDGNRLTYSEYGRPDYKTYSIEDYDIICVK